MDFDTTSLMRMAAAVAFGGLIGFNRDIYGKPTGIRAHALVSLGAAILVMAVADKPDPSSRVIQGVIAGIGFLGGGVILRGARNLHVYHLVTAASLWVTTGIGILCGLGLLWFAGMATAMTLFVLIVGMYLDRWLYGTGGVKPDERE